MPKKLTYEFVKSQFERKGYQLLSTEYRNANYKLRVICPREHSWNTSYNNFKQGRICPICANNNKRLEYSYIRRIFEKDGYQLLSKEYKNANQRLETICPRGHKWKVRFRSFRQSRRCPKCYIEDLKKNNKRGGKNNSNWKGGVKKLNIPLYNTYAHKISWCEEVRKDPDNPEYLQVRCTESGCRRWFRPATRQVIDRIAAIELIGGVNFYCSKECKQNCSIYRRVKYPKGLRVDYSREVQPELAELVFERDEYECQRCGSKKNLECHHYESIYQNPIESADVDMCITLCKKCHKLAHKDIGCRYVDLTRNSLCGE